MEGHTGSSLRRDAPELTFDLPPCVLQRSEVLGGAPSPLSPSLNLLEPDPLRFLARRPFPRSTVRPISLESVTSKLHADPAPPAGISNDGQCAPALEPPPALALAHSPATAATKATRTSSSSASASTTTSPSFFPSLCSRGPCPDPLVDSQGRRQQVRPARRPGRPRARHDGCASTVLLAHLSRTPS